MHNTGSQQSLSNHQFNYITVTVTGETTRLGVSLQLYSYPAVTVSYLTLRAANLHSFSSTTADSSFTFIKKRHLVAKSLLKGSILALRFTMLTQNLLIYC